jgi:hypothetical protein
MTGKYAENTTVAVSKSRDEIERTLTRFGATAFAYYANSAGRVAVSFEIHNLRVEMTMLLPKRDQFRLSPAGYERADHVIDREWEKACRQRWRSLANGIKAKLALVDDGISTVEREFLADIMTPDGSTVGQKLLPQLRDIAREGRFPAIMPGGVEAKVIAIGEGR